MIKEKPCKSFIKAVDIVFEPKYTDRDSREYWNNVIRPEREMEALRVFESYEANRE